MTSTAREDESQLVENDELDRNLQPHLGPSVTLDHINPALNTETNDSVSEHEIDTTQSTRQNQNGTQPVGDSASNRTQSDHVTVQYSSRHGETIVVPESIVERQANGEHVIRTQQCCELAPHRHRTERPIKIKHIKLLQAFSTLAIFIFFPCGIPALFYAFKCEKEFHAGILRGDIDLARKLAKRSERLIIFSIMGALLVAVAVFAVVERNLMGDNDEYWKSRSQNRVLPSG